MKIISLKEVEFIAFTAARKFMTYHEPIPDWQTRLPNKLESCLAVPFQRFQKKNLYSGLVAKAAILFYLLIKNHPFQNLPAPRPGIYFTYALACEGGSYYIGHTQDLQQRWVEHLKGSGSDWTKRYKPLYVAYYEEYPSREQAVIREKELKTGFGRKWLRREIAAGHLPTPQTRARQAGGNKRIAVTTLLVFLYKNEKWLRVDNQEFYNFSIWIAQSPASLKAEVIKAIEKFLKNHLAKLS